MESFETHNMQKQKRFKYLKINDMDPQLEK